MSNPTALDFTALVEDVRQQRRQQQIGILDFIEISSHRLFNLLQTDPWCNKKTFLSSCLIIDSRPTQDFANSHIRGSININSSEDVQSVLGSNSDSLAQCISVVVYGDGEEVIEKIRRRPDRVKLLFILKDNYSAFLSSYSCLCLSSNDEKTNLKRQGEVWIKLPTEIIPNRLYLVHQDTHSIMTSIAPKLLSIDYILDISTRQMLTDDISTASQSPPPYAAISPDPQLRVDPQSRSSVSVVVSDGPLEMIVEELYRRISITGTKTLVFSTDTPSVAAAAVAAFLMSYRNWGMNTAVGCLMSKSIHAVWPPTQLDALRTFQLPTSKDQIKWYSAVLSDPNDQIKEIMAPKRAKLYHPVQLVAWDEKWDEESSPVIFLNSQIATELLIKDKVKVIVTVSKHGEGRRVVAVCRISHDRKFDKILSSNTRKSKETTVEEQHGRDDICLWCPECHQSRPVGLCGGNAALFAAFGCCKPFCLIGVISVISGDDVFFKSASQVTMRMKNVVHLVKSKKQESTQTRNWNMFDQLQTPSSQILLHGALLNLLVAEFSPLRFFLNEMVVEFEVTAVQFKSSLHSIETPSLNPSESSPSDMSQLPPQDWLCPNTVCSKCQTTYPMIFRIDQYTRLFVLPPVNMTSPIRRRSDDLSDSRPQTPIGMSRVGGLSHIVQELTDLFIIPLMFPNVFKSFGIAPPKGVLLYGPPGTGKTLLARALVEEIELRWDELWRELSLKFDSETTQPPPSPVAEILSSSDVMTGCGESGIHAVFRRCRERLATSNRGSLIFVDEIDCLCPERDNFGETERRIVSAFLTNLDGLSSDSRIVLLGTTNRPNALDPALRRAGRLDREIEVDVPNGDDRVSILFKMLETMSHNLSDQDVTKIAWDCQAFVGADLRCLCTLSALKAIEEFSTKKETGATHDTTAVPQIRLDHFLEALKNVRPSAMKSVAVEIPKVRWSDVGGYEDVKQSLQECVEWPIKYREVFSEMRLTAPRGLLLYGPPGCSKTLLAKAVASESKMNFIAIKGPELFSKYVGESEKAVRDIFRKAQQNSPCVIFFDEVDSLGGSRDTFGGGSGVESRVLSQMLNEMDGIGVLKQVVVIGATNRPDLLDAALLRYSHPPSSFNYAVIRPGRLDRLVYVPLPDLLSREKVLQVHLRHLPLQKVPDDVWTVIPTARVIERRSVEFLPKRTDDGKSSIADGTLSGEKERDDDDSFISISSIEEKPQSMNKPAELDERELFIRELSKRTSGYSGAELAMVCREAAMMALRERIELLEKKKQEKEGKVMINWRHCMACLDIVKPRIPMSTIKFYENYQNRTTTHH